MNTGHPALTIDDLESGAIEAGSFDHESHVYLAWLYVGEYGVGDAIVRFSSALRRLTLQLGVPGKYHETITWFFLLLIGERRALMENDDWQAFRLRNEDLFDRRHNILQRYYSPAVLEFEDARRNFVLPDRIAA